MENEKFSILVVEDEFYNRKNMVEYLHLYYTNIFEAENGLDAYEIYQERQPNLIITDISMPKMDGLELIEKIREQDDSTPIVIISAFSDQSKLLRAIKLKLIDYLIKPVTRESLKALLQKIKVQSETLLSKEVRRDIVLGDGFVFQEGSKILLHNNQYIKLTRSQATALDLLVKFRNKVVSSIDIFYYVQNDYSLEYSDRSVRNLILRIRKILPETMIENVYGRGYMLIVEE